MTAPALPPGYLEKAHEGKRSYDSKKVARQHARMTSARFGGEPKVPYRCRICGLFHVGRDPR
jgi:hypothetical protein